MTRQSVIMNKQQRNPSVIYQRSNVPTFGSGAEECKSSVSIGHLQNAMQLLPNFQQQQQMFGNDQYGQSHQRQLYSQQAHQFPHNSAH